MKEVNVITIHFGENHGSALQAYALTHYIKSRNCSCKLIDYIPQRYNLWTRYHKSYIKHYRLPLVITYFPIYALKTIPGRRIFRQFLKKYIPLTQKYKSNKALFLNPPEADIYIAGSDQIWNTDYNGFDEKAYFFEYVKHDKEIISYAASFGKEYPLNEFEMDYFKENLKSFDAISVREEAGVSILSECGYSGQLVCDPTLLLSRQEWENIAEELHFDEKYVLVYVMDAIYEKLVENAYRIANAINAKVFVIDFSPIKDDRIDKCFYRCSPNMFISLIRGAEFVVTNSFHGTVFSTIFEKPLLILKKSNYNSRLETILRKTNQTNKLFESDYIVDKDEINLLLDKCSQTEEMTELKEWITSSKIFLNRYLE